MMMYYADDRLEEDRNERPVTYTIDRQHNYSQIRINFLRVGKVREACIEVLARGALDGSGSFGGAHGCYMCSVVCSHTSQARPSSKSEKSRIRRVE